MDTFENRRFDFMALFPLIFKFSELLRTTKSLFLAKAPFDRLTALPSTPLRDSEQSRTVSLSKGGRRILHCDPGSERLQSEILPLRPAPRQNDKLGGWRPFKGRARFCRRGCELPGRRVRLVRAPWRESRGARGRFVPHPEGRRRRPPCRALAAIRRVGR